MLRSFLMTYLDLITQQAGGESAIYLGGDSPDETPIEINSSRPTAKYGTYVTEEGLGDGTSWRYRSSHTIWGSGTSPAGSITYSYWVYFPEDVTPGTSVFFNRGSTSVPSPTSTVFRTGVRAPYEGDGGAVWYSGTSVQPGVGFELGKWHHVAWVEGDSIYVDGQPVRTTATRDTARIMVLGAQGGTGTIADPPANSPRLDHVVAIAKTLSAEEIQAQFNYPGFQGSTSVDTVHEVIEIGAEMLDAEFSNIGHAKINAAPMHAEARSGYHEVFGDRAPYTRRVLATGAWAYLSGWQYRSTPFNVPAFGEADFVVRVPDGRIDPTDTVSSRTIRLARIAGTGSIGVSALRADGTSGNFTMGTGLSGGVLSNGVFTINVPLDVGYVYFRISNSGSTNATWDNPVNDIDSDQSYFTVSAAPVPVTKVTAPVAHASALAVQPTLDITANILRYVPATVVSAEAFTPGVLVQTAADVAMQTTPATAEAMMTRALMPNAGVSPDAALGTAAMNTTWFSSEVRANVAYAEADAEMLDYADIISDDNIAVGVGTLTGRGSIREPWLSINGIEVDRNHTDPYWQRVARRSTEGPLPPSANLWFRLNQREGNFAQRLSSAGVFVTNPPQGYINGYNIEGDFEWGAAGPNGKRGLIARDAVFGRSTTGTYDENTPRHRSVEYTVRVEPGHTGRMEIARGRERHYIGIAGSPDRTFYTGIHDGRVYFGGHSIKRIDDGEWHHVVVTTTQDGNRLYFAIYIDGELDRTLSSVDNTGGTQGFSPLAEPVRFLGGDTEYPFQGEILDIVTRGAVQSHEVKELYLDMFGFKAMRAGAPMTASADSYQGHKVISSMKRMLLVSWMPVGSNEADAHRIGWNAWNDKGFYERSITARNGRFGPMLGYGWDEEIDVGRYLVTVVQPDRVDQYKTALKPEVLEQNRSYMFVDKVTGRKRMLDLVNDVDLDQFDVIAFQAYPNKQYTDMYDRQMHEAFLESVRTALVMGKKMWINDPYLAADLGLVSDVEEVPVLGRVLNGVIQPHDRYGSVGGPDVRGYEVAPFIGLEGGKHPKPASGALPVLYPAIPDGSQFGVNDIWGGDVHHNNGYRVVNEIEGLTDIPSWELDEMFWRDRTNMLPQNDDEYYHYGIRMENRTGIDYEWGPDDGSDNFPAKKESTGTGLKVGDEFYDYLNFRNVYEIFNRLSIPSQNQRDGRVYSTLAIPPGHLKVGTPVTTFRRTLWNDYGDEIVNPYRDFIRNAVIRPGDRLPDGRKISGYAYMEFAEHPSFGNMAGVSWTKQLTGLPGTGGNASTPPENEYTFEWDYVSTVRRSFIGRGAVNSVQIKFHYGPRHSNGATAMASKAEVIEWPLPLAPSVSERYATISMPHQTWNSRGISWLTMVDVEEAEVALAHGSSAQANARMVSPMVETDFDNEVAVGAAQANGRIVDPDETVLKSTNVLAYAATARGTMTGLQGGYRAEAATAFANMPQNVRRPLDVEEVLFFTVSFTQETIYVRMEEN